MIPTLRSLLTNTELALTLRTAEHALPAEALDTPIEWVHSSDLADPTPFLSPGQVLLSTGTQFETGATASGLGRESDNPDPALVFAYVRRLRDAGVAGLGFGTEVVRAGTPEALVEACLQLGLPLFEVPYRTPFIAVARAAADMASEERFARRSWSLSAQRAIAISALRPDGLSASLDELSRQLGHWVALFDADGRLDRVFPPTAFGGASAEAPNLVAESARREAERLLQRGQRASSNIVVGAETVALQTLGRHGKLRGVLALGGGADLDQASNEVVTVVIALAGLALEQNHALGHGVSVLRTGLLQALKHGQIDLVQAVSTEMWGALPAEPVQIALINAPDQQRETITEHLEVRVAEAPRTVFFAASGEQIVLCIDASPRSAVLLSALSTRFGLSIGLSSPGSYAEIERGVAQATQALAATQNEALGVRNFSDLARSGVLSYLRTTDASEIGLAVLQPVRSYDADSGGDLVRTLRVWLEQNAQLDATAQLLGVHRHTVRARIALAEKLLGRDLSSFSERAELWSALLVARDELGSASPPAPTA